MTMPELDALPADAFMQMLGGLFEHAPEVAAAVVDARPFHRARALHDAMMAHVHGSGPAAQLRLIQAHPELAGAVALTDESASEQGRLGFTRLGAGEHADLAALNAEYRARFGMPCIVALARHATRDSVVLAMRARLGRTPDAERATALEEIGHITAARLAAILGRTHGTLSLHALDTVRGGAAPDLGYALVREADGARLRQGRTNDHGRTDGPLLTGIDLEPGAYRLEFAVGAYHRAAGVPVADPPFLDVVPIAFGVADPGAHYHVPIQFTPWSYGTYRGS